MVLRDNGEVETEEESDDDSMPSLEDDNGNEELLHDGYLLVIRRVLNMQMKDEDEA